MSVDALPYASFREYKRLYSIVVVTDDGLYKEGEVPSSYGGDTEVEIEVVHEILMVDSAGRIRRLVFDIPEAKDRNNKLGGGYGIYEPGDPPTPVTVPYKNEDYPETTGGATEPTKLYIRVSNKLDPQNMLRADKMVEISGGWPPPHIP